MTTAMALYTAQSNNALLPLQTTRLGLDIGGKRLIDGIDLRLGPGITMVMGPNGAGKSLLLRLLHGMLIPTAGRIDWRGAALSPAITKRQSLVFQKPVLLRRSVAANIDFVLKARGRRDPARRDALLDYVGLSHHATQPARLLSGGEQQRLAMARALVTEPEVLFLDEPTASLDPASVLRIEEIVQDVAVRGTKIIFVTHDLGQAKRLADDVVFLANGKLAEHRPAEQFFSKPQTEAAQAYLEGRILI